MRQQDLRAKIGFVPQKAVLFSGTIADNIRYGRDDASDDEMRAGGDDRTGHRTSSTAMPDGFDSVIAQGGTNLSGGQKQRLSIARALVRRPEIYVFDDSFSALDFATDARLRAALKARRPRRHGVHRVAAHRHRHGRRPDHRAGRRPRRRHRHARELLET